jgi:4-hydroxy-3-polyprenylbenzoate decarboxylase
MPAFYNHPKSIDDIVAHIVARVLDQFGITARFAKRWDGKMRMTSQLNTEPTDNN